MLAPDGVLSPESTEFFGVLQVRLSSMVHTRPPRTSAPTDRYINFDSKVLIGTVHS
jgi:hypothetical protein